MTWDIDLKWKEFIQSIEIFEKTKLADFPGCNYCLNSSGISLLCNQWKTQMNEVVFVHKL